jgi:hypothetical protein
VAVVALESQRRAFVRLVRDAGLATTSGTLGVLATGTLDVATTLDRLLAALPNSPADAVWELVSHPGYPDQHLDAARTKLRASRGLEHAALLDKIPRSAIELGSWRELVAAAGTLA